MGLHQFIMKHGIGSPGYIARRMAKQYRALKAANPLEPDRSVLFRVYANRVAAQSIFGGPEVYRMSRADPSLIKAAVENNTNIFRIIRHAVLVEHPEFQNPFAPADRFEVLDRVLAEVLDREVSDWRESRISMLSEEKVISDTESTRIYNEENIGPKENEEAWPLEGDSVHDALFRFIQACKAPGTLFITEEWVRPRIEYLEVLLSEPITADEASALGDAISKRAKLDDVIEWLAESDLQWQEFIQRIREIESNQRDLDKAMERINYERKRIECEMALRTGANNPWEVAMHDTALQSKHDPEPVKREFGRLSRLCPKCGSTELTWFYYIQPPIKSGLRGLPRFTGWVTACELCGIAVDYLGTEFRMRAEANGLRVMY